MATPKQMWEQQQLQVQRVKNSGIISYNGSPVADDKEEEMSRSALALFRAKEEEIEKKKSEVKDKVQAQLGRVEEATKRLSEIQDELEALTDPMRKELAIIRKRIDVIHKELKPLGLSCQRKEKEYKEALEALNEKSREKSQLVSKLMELVGESERMRMKKLEELNKHFETLR
ncbi:hypothetical protein ACFX13_006784 [Malus domestica]|uniref:RAB6-interacting golgin n=1 Tax=Malus domestica TaxID=3750 RepID=A0A498IN90_MALDO|nr:interaptin-like [Malus domestica]XP_050109607.1 uncharacterized protein LOC126588548 isoform X2 [Malus sylvestris]RXH83497.1 hypothetical protein DVH24_005750 [Malus domestica]